MLTCWWGISFQVSKRISFSPVWISRRYERRYWGLENWVMLLLRRNERLVGLDSYRKAFRGFTGNHLIYHYYSYIDRSYAKKKKNYYLAALKCTLKTSVTASLCVPPTFFFCLPFPIASAIVHLFARLIKW